MENYSQLQNNLLFIAQIISLCFSGGALIGLLWQTKYPYKKKIKINFNAASSIYHNKKININLCVFTAINIGHINVNIEEFGIMNSKNKILFKINNSNLSKLEPITDKIKKLPLKLNAQTKILIAYSLDDIIDNVNISNFDNNKKISVYFKDSLGKLTKQKILKNRNKIFYEKLKAKLVKKQCINKKSTSKILKLTVIWFNNEKEYGFGRAKNCNEDIFFNKSNIINDVDQVYEGDIISIKLVE